MKKTLQYIVILIGTFIVASCGDDQEKNGKGGAAEGEQQTKPYPVIEVPTKTITANNTYPVSIEGLVNSEVRAKVSGYITNVLVDEGQKVSKGQILFKLETQSLNQDAKAAKANVNAAQVEVDKLKPLVEKDIISSVQLETAKAKLAQASSNYQSILENIGYANIKSPVNGYVGSINLREGALVSPSSSKPLTTVTDISKVYAYFSMNETDYLDFIQNKDGKTIEEKIENLPKVKLELANGSIYEEEGKIQTINSQINESTGSISFRAIFDNPARILTNGNSGRILIPEVYENAIVVPQASTFERQGSILVLKIAKGDTVVSAKIKTKSKVDNLYVVESGVEKGDSIVAKGVNKISPNTKIKPVPTPFDSIAKPTQKVFQ